MKSNKQLMDKFKNEVKESNFSVLTFVSQMVTVGITQKIPAQDMAEYIEQRYKVVSSLSEKEESLSLLPAVPTHQSVTDDYLVCLEDGEKLKMIKRHLEVVHGMTPEEYREKWGLPEDYPVTCKNDSAVRREYVKSVDLGRIGRGPVLQSTKRVTGHKKAS